MDTTPAFKHQSGMSEMGDAGDPLAEIFCPTANNAALCSGVYFPTHIQPVPSQIKLTGVNSKICIITDLKCYSRYLHCVHGHSWPPIPSHPLSTRRMRGPLHPFTPNRLPPLWFGKPGTTTSAYYLQLIPCVCTGPHIQRP
jgi:hypothetical protein